MRNSLGFLFSSFLFQCQHLSVRAEQHQSTKYQTTLSWVEAHRRQCTNSRSQASSIFPHPTDLRNLDHLLDGHGESRPHCPHSAMPWAWQAETFVFLPLCFTFGIWDSLMGFLHLIVVQMFYVWWITSPTFFPTCFSSRAQSIYTYLNSHLDLIKKSLPVGFLTVDLHVWPDFHGNRSPLTDLTLKGMVRNSLSLQRGQYRVKRKKIWKKLFFQFWTYSSSAI